MQSDSSSSSPEQASEPVDSNSLTDSSKPNIQESPEANDAVNPSESAAEWLVTEFQQESQPYVGQWNTLVSTTNWAKGRIVCLWRDALRQANAPSTAYSDEAWSQRVGGVTGQHVGRLRRVYQRFGDVYGDFPQLYWTHFQAAVDWEDAEMWLEGAVQNSWSVAKMRRTRWETLADVNQPEPKAEEIIASETDEDFEPAGNDEPLVGESAEISDAEQPLADSEARQQHKAAEEGSSDSSESGSAQEADAETSATEFVRPFENLAELPNDLADAFESFKLAILRHKSEDWQQISREDVLASLDALKELALAPPAEDAPF